MREMYPRFPMGRAKVFTLSYDDGVEQDVRFLELLRAYEVKATFHLNSNFPPEDIVHPAGAIHRRGSPVHARRSQSTQVTTSTGRASTTKGFIPHAPARSRWVRSWTARSAPHPAQYQPVSASVGQVG